MRLLTRNRLIVLVVAVAVLAINVVALRWSSHFFTAKQSRALLRYGDRVSSLKGKSLTGKGTADFGRKYPANLVIYFSSNQPGGFSTALVKSAETLSQRHKKDGLGIVAIVQKENADLKNLVDLSLVTYDVIVDDNRDIQNQLGLQDGESGVFLFDKEGLCRFSTRRPVTAGDLRQLVAMEFLNVDPFENSSETSLKEGKSLGSFSLLDVRSLAQTSIDELRSGTAAPTHYIFFTADCSICSLPQYLEDFRKFLINQLKGDVENQAVLIFDFNFSRNDVVEHLKSNDIRTAAYIAKEQLPELEYAGQTRRRHEKDVVLVQTDVQRNVLDITPLKSKLKPTTGGSKIQPRFNGPAYEEMFAQIPFTAYDVATYQGKYFLTDVDGNRLLVVTDNLNVERSLGRIGSRPGRLLHPGYLDIGHDGTIFVADSGNERIVKFDQAGSYLGELRVNDYQGLAVGAQNELYLGQPQEGHLITVYSNSGTKLRSFGELKKYSQTYGATARDKDDAYKIAFNRVRLSTDTDGNLYVSFMLTPLIQKYSPDGTLLFERRLEAPEIDRLMQEIQKTKYIATGGDGVDARIVALDPVIVPATGNIIVPLVDGSIYVADREGNKVTVLRPNWPHRDDSFYPFVAGLGAKGELLVTPFPPKRWYRLQL